MTVHLHESIGLCVVHPAVCHMHVHGRASAVGSLMATGVGTPISWLWQPADRVSAPIGDQYRPCTAAKHVILEGG